MTRQALSIQLGGCVDLEYLDLAGNHIEAFGAMCLSSLPPKCPAIKHFDVSHNPITDRPKPPPCHQTPLPPHRQLAVGLRV